MKKRKSRMKIALCVLFCLILLGGAAVLGINAYVKGNSADRILSPEQAAELADVDCILVLGCFVHENGRPSDMLADRLQRGIELYEAGAAPKLLMSGDHGQKEYNEVGAMKQAAVEAGVPPEDVFMDHAGFSTYDSVYRTKELVCYALGTAWFMVVYARTAGAVGLWAALSWCVVPFIIPDLVKLGLALWMSQRLRKIKRAL